MEPVVSTDFWGHLEKLVETQPLLIDRPKGSHHPRYPEVIYPLDYGYLEGTSSADGGGIDVWVGTVQRNNQAAKMPREISALVLTVDLFKKDVEIKILLDCNQREQAQIIDFLNTGIHMKATLIRNPRKRE